MLPFRARENLGAMIIKGYSGFSKPPALQEPHHQIVQCYIQDTRWEGAYSSAAPANWAMYVWDVDIQIKKNNTLTASLQRGKAPPTSVLDMTLNNLMIRLQ